MSEPEKVVVESEELQEVEQVQQVDLSAVPERLREVVDVDLYAKDADYKEAIDHGWKPREIYAEDGGDESDWTGFRQFNRNYAKSQEIKKLRETTERVEQSQRALIDTFESERKSIAEQAIVQRERELKEAIELGNAQDAVAIQNDLTTRRMEAQKEQPKLPEPLIVVDLRRKNSFLNPNHADFDPIVNAEFEARAKEKADFYYKTYRRQLSDFEIRVICEDAFDMVKDKAKTPASQEIKKAAVVSKPTQGTTRVVDYKKSLTSVGQETYSRLLERSGKEVADGYAKRVYEGGLK